MREKTNFSYKTFNFKGEIKINLLQPVNTSQSGKFGNNNRVQGHAYVEN